MSADKGWLKFLGAGFDEKDKTYFCLEHPERKYSGVEDLLRHFGEVHSSLAVRKEVVVEAPVGVGKVKKRVGFKEALMGGGDVTSQTIVSDMGKIDGNLPMKTEVKFPMELTLLDLLAVRCDVSDCPKTASLLRAFARWYRVNMVSYKRQGRTEAFEAFKSLWNEELRKKDDDMFGRKS